MEQAECSEMLAYKIQMPGITQKKAYNIQNTAKVWNQESPMATWAHRSLLYGKFELTYCCIPDFTDSKQEECLIVK